MRLQFLVYTSDYKNGKEPYWCGLRHLIGKLLLKEVNSCHQIKFKKKPKVVSRMERDLKAFGAFIVDSDYTEDMGQWFKAVYRLRAPTDWVKIEFKEILNDYFKTKQK